MKKIKKTIIYLNKTFPSIEENKIATYFKKTHIPILFLIANKAREIGISHKLFREWAYQFFLNYDTKKEYKKGCLSSFRKDKVQIRIDEMSKDFFEFIETNIKKLDSICMKVKDGTNGS